MNADKAGGRLSERWGQKDLEEGERREAQKNTSSLTALIPFLDSRSEGWMILLSSAPLLLSWRILANGFRPREVRANRMVSMLIAAGIIAAVVAGCKWPLPFEEVWLAFSGVTK